MTQPIGCLEDEEPWRKDGDREVLARPVEAALGEVTLVRPVVVRTADFPCAAVDSESGGLVSLFGDVVSVGGLQGVALAVHELPGGLRLAEEFAARLCTWPSAPEPARVRLHPEALPYALLLCAWLETLRELFRLPRTPEQDERLVAHLRPWLMQLSPTALAAVDGGKAQAFYASVHSPASGQPWPPAVEACSAVAAALCANRWVDATELSRVTMLEARTVLRLARSMAASAEVGSNALHWAEDLERVGAALGTSLELRQSFDRMLAAVSKDADLGRRHGRLLVYASAALALPPASCDVLRSASAPPASLQAALQDASKSLLALRLLSSEEPLRVCLASLASLYVRPLAQFQLEFSPSSK